MSEIFRVEGSDRREEFLSAMESGEEYVAQRPTGKDVEFFSPTTGFVLLRSEKPINPSLGWVQKVKSAAELSLGPQLELREFYYTMRGREELAKVFNANNIYPDVLGAINNMEVICDIEREVITVGNLPKGLIYYGHRSGYNNAEKPVGFTENLARQVLRPYDIRNAMNIIQIEKSAAATRLVAMGFSELTNSVLTTTGGFFTRAIYALAERFKDSKEIIFFCDGDVYGNSMLRAVEYGAKATPHLTPRQAFPAAVNPSIHIAGLYPSVAEMLKLPNDIETKRPLSSPMARAMVRFFSQYNLVDQRDIDTWKRDKTYELEALSTSFKNRRGEPVGLGLYLVEYMRLNDIKCKPQPTGDDEELEEEFVEEAKEAFKSQISPSVDTDFVSDIVEAIEDPINEWLEEISGEVYDKYEDEVEDHARDQGAVQVRRHLLKQYEIRPTKEKFNITDVARKLFSSVDVSPEIDLEEVKTKITELMESIKPEIHRILEESTYTEEVQLKDLTELGEPRDFYDIVEGELGIDPEDAVAVREALRARLD